MDVIYQLIDMAIEDKTGADSFKKVAFREAWKGRTRALWSIAALGVAAGVVVGLMAPFIPLAAGLFSPTVAAASSLSAAVHAIPASVAIFASYGMGIGSLVGGILGGPSGSIGAMVDEVKKRGTFTDKENQDGKAIASNQQQENNQTAVKQQKPKARYINPKVMLMFAALGAIGGAILLAGMAATGGIAATATAAAVPGAGAAIAQNALMPGMSAILTGELATNTTAIGAYVIGVMASFGALFGFNGPKMATDLQDFTGRLLSGEALGTSWEKKRSDAVQNSKTTVASPETISQPNFAENNSKNLHVSKLGNRGQFNSYEDMVMQSMSSAQTEQISRK